MCRLRYTQEARENLASLADLLRIAAVPLALIAGVLSVPLLLPSIRWARRWAILWFASAVGCWVSVNFLTLEIGVLDGRLTEVPMPPGFTSTTALSLAAAVIGSAALALRATRGAAIAAIVLNVMLAGVTVAQVAGAQREGSRRSAASGRSLFEFAKAGACSSSFSIHFSRTHFKKFSTAIHL